MEKCFAFLFLHRFGHGTEYLYFWCDAVFLYYNRQIVLIHFTFKDMRKRNNIARHNYLALHPGYMSRRNLSIRASKCYSSRPPPRAL